MKIKLYLIFSCIFLFQSAAASLTHEQQIKQNKPGIYGKWLEQNNQIKDACLLYEQVLKSKPSCETGIKLRLANCYARNKDWSKADPLFKSLFEDKFMITQMEALYEPSKNAFTQKNSKNWQQLAQFMIALQPDKLNIKQREQLAELFSLLKIKAEKVKNKKWIETARNFLFSVLPETKIAQAFFKNLEERKWWNLKTEVDLITRAKILSQLNQNDAVIETLQPVISGKIKKSDNICEAGYLVGKALRNKRSYQEASNSLLQVINNCSDDSRRNAFYIAARIAAIVQTEESLKLIDQFLKEYPNHSFTDDVLLWKINVLKKLGTDKQVDDAFDYFIKNFKNGDMYDETIFQRAFFLAGINKRQQALDLLKSQTDERSRYWYGRLLLYPSLTSDKKSTKRSERIQGRKILKEVSVKNPSSYYGYMAAKNIDEKIRKRPNSTFDPANLDENFNFQTAVCLNNAGFSDEAFLFLENLFNVSTSVKERLAIANYGLQINRPDKTHQAMRFLGLNSPLELAYPEAYKREIAAASESAQISPWLLLGLAREESAFDKDALSWAGAQGLCQIMPSVGVESAERLKIKHVDNETLFEPEINTLIAADYWARDLKALGHPLFAIAAYNGGQSNVKNWIKQNTKPFALDVFVEQIPFPQTRDYVKKVTGAWITYAWIYDDINSVEFPLQISK